MKKARFPESNPMAIWLVARRIIAKYDGANCRPEAMGFRVREVAPGEVNLDERAVETALDAFDTLRLLNYDTNTTIGSVTARQINKLSQIVAIMDPD
jgi:hypothetical protein